MEINHISKPKKKEKKEKKRVIALMHAKIISNILIKLKLYEGNQ